MKNLTVQLDDTYQGELDEYFLALNVKIGESPLRFNKSVLEYSTEISKKPFSIDFVSKKNLYRFNKGRSQPNLLAKALGVKSGDCVLDLTAGECNDALSLLFWDIDVVAIENSPLVYLLLQDARRRAESYLKFENEKLFHRLSRLKIVYADSFQWVEDNDLTQFNAVYLDPMFPEKKSSLSTKSMQILQGELTETNDQKVVATMNHCLQRVQRVVVKRPLKAPAFLLPVKHSFLGKSIRFDMYSKLKESINH